MNEQTRYKSGDDCPNCRRGTLTTARAVKPFRLICPRCCRSLN